jgi:hypothetical protein
MSGDNVTPIRPDASPVITRTEPTTLEDRERAMDAIVDAETTLDLLQALWTANDDSSIDLGTDCPGTALNTLRALQRHLRRAREALEHSEG